MKIYLAARYSRREELCHYAKDLRALGHTITSRWLLGNHQLTDEQLSTEGTVEQRERFALEDWEDLLDAELCISFTEGPRSVNSRGGRHVEYGAALAHGHDCWVVGPLENVFHCLPWVRKFADWQGALSGLDQLTEDEDPASYVLSTPEDQIRAVVAEASLLEFSGSTEDGCIVRMRERGLPGVQWALINTLRLADVRGWHVAIQDGAIYISNARDEARG